MIYCTLWYKTSLETSKTLWKPQSIIVSGPQTAKLSICISIYLTGCVSLCLPVFLLLSVCMFTCLSSLYCNFHRQVIFFCIFHTYCTFTSPLVSLAPTTHTASLFHLLKVDLGRGLILHRGFAAIYYNTETGRNEIGGATGRLLRMRIGISFTSDGLRVKRQRKQIPLVNHIKESQSVRPDEAPTEIESMPDTDVAGRRCVDGRCVEIDGVDLRRRCLSACQRDNHWTPLLIYEHGEKSQNSKRFRLTTHKSSTIYHCALCNVDALWDLWCSITSVNLFL